MNKNDSNLSTNWELTGEFHVWWNQKGLEGRENKALPQRTFSITLE